MKLITLCRVITTGLILLVSANGVVQAKSFHIDIPASSKTVLELKTRYAKPDIKVEHDFASGTKAIAADGSVIFGNGTVYFIDGQYGEPAYARKETAMTDNGQLHLQTREDTFALYSLESLLKHKGSMPHEELLFPAGPWPDGISRPKAHGIASDGSFVLGELIYESFEKKLVYVNKSSNEDKETLADAHRSPTTSDAMWWTKEEGFHRLNRPKGWRLGGVYKAIYASTDGKTLLGEIVNNQEPWNSVQPVLIDRVNQTATALGHAINHESAVTQPRGLSGDGKVVIVIARAKDKYPFSHIEYFSWRKSEGYKPVKTQPETSGTEYKYDVLGLNYDGSIMVGVVGAWDSRRSELTGTGLVWVNGKAQKANDFLEAQGLDLRGWEITRVSSISHDGKILGGNADGTYLKNVAWFANLGDKTWNFPVHDASEDLAQALADTPDVKKHAITVTAIPAKKVSLAVSSHSTTATKPKAKAEISESSKPFELSDYAHFKVVPVDPNSPIAPEVKAMWAKGFYIHLKTDGNFGFNTDDPGPYVYLPVNRWKNKNGVLTLTLDQVVYSFTLPTVATVEETTLTTVDSTWNAFRMTYVTKNKGGR